MADWIKLKSDGKRDLSVRSTLSSTKELQLAINASSFRVSGCGDVRGLHCVFVQA